MEGRILPHQHHVDIAPQIEPDRTALGEMIAGYPLHRDRMGDRGQPVMGVERQRIDIVMPHLVPARLGSEHQRKTGIPGDVDGFQWVHLNRDAQRHE